MRVAVSGGSFNYLYRQEPYSIEDLLEMAQWLSDHDMEEAARATLAMIPQRAQPELADLWKAVEWFTSADWDYEPILEAHEAWQKGKEEQHEGTSAPPQDRPGAPS